MVRPNRSKANRQSRQRKRAKKRTVERATFAGLAPKKKRIEPKVEQITFKAKRRVRTTKPRRTVSVTPIREARKDREILIVSRKGQPQVFTEIKEIERKDYPPQSVSSSWLSTIGYFYKDKIGTFTTKTGRQYKINNFPFKVFEEWYYAHSKGTFFNEFIKEQYTIIGIL